MDSFLNKTDLSLDIELVDSHCHLHELMSNLSPVHERWLSDGQPRTVDLVLEHAQKAGVRQCLSVGTTLSDSRLALKYAEQYNQPVGVGIHPHEAEKHQSGEIKLQFRALVADQRVKVIGECGLDYYYELSPRRVQIELLRFQIELALEHDLPLSFHVREAFDDFWEVIDSYRGVRAAVHSFTDSEANLEKALERGFMVGINGIATFSSSQNLDVIYRTVPQQSMLLETDAPYLTPVPYRGTMCEPGHVRVVAEHLCRLRGDSLADLAAYTTANAKNLFHL